jgi:hypothetical protein
VDAAAQGRRLVFEDLDVDDSDSPSIGLAPDGASWEDVADHLKIAHNPVLVGPDGSGQYAGAYWTGTRMEVAADLGPDRDEALDEFRDILRERGDL